MKIFGGKTAAAFVLATIAIGSASYAAGVANTQQTGYLLCFDAKTKQVTYPGKLVCPKGKKPLSLGARGLTGLTGAPGPAGLAGPSGAAGVAGASGSSGATGQNLFVYDSTGANLGALVAANSYSNDTTFTVLKNGFLLPYFPQTGLVGSRWGGQYGDSGCTGPVYLGVDTADLLSFYGAANPLLVRGLSRGTQNRTDFMAPVLPAVTLPAGTTTSWWWDGTTCRAQNATGPENYYKLESIGFALDAVGPLRIGN